METNVRSPLIQAQVAYLPMLERFGFLLSSVRAHIVFIVAYSWSPSVHVLDIIPCVEINHQVGVHVQSVKLVLSN
jgi:hypothetical protein